MSRARRMVLICSWALDLAHMLRVTVTHKMHDDLLMWLALAGD